MDQIGVFLAGRVNDHVGGLIQGTFDGIASATFLDNTDVRVTTDGKLFGQEANFGLSLNNSPSLSDPWNSTAPWGYRFVSSALAVDPQAGTVLGGGLAGNSMGLTAYTWIDDHYYVDLGLYRTMGPSMMQILGQGYSYGSDTAPMPYARIAYEYDWGPNNAHVGGTYFYSRFNPAVASYTANGTLGHDSYTDWQADAGYQYLTNSHAVTIDSHYDYEMTGLRGTTAAGGSSQPNNWLTDAAVTLTYYYQNTYGATVSWANLAGTRNALLYPGGVPDFGSANGKPNTNSITLEADWVPFGKDGSPFRPFANLKLGVQYKIYTMFNGGTSNYDGFGRNASDNNVLYVFLWTIF